jgi:hypothetical protein
MDARTAAIKLDPIWLELLPATNDLGVDQAAQP